MNFKMKSQLSEHHLFLKTNARKEEHFYKIVVIKFRNILVEKENLKIFVQLHFAVLSNFHKGTKSKKNQA